jgi:hypothetical protein
MYKWKENLKNFYSKPHVCCQSYKLYSHSFSKTGEWQIIGLFCTSDYVSEVGLWLNQRCFDLFLTFHPTIFTKRKNCGR